MATGLTQQDLLIVDPNLDLAALLEDWAWLLSGEFRAMAASKFGDWFVQRPDGSVEMLDLVEGKLKKVAETGAEFQARLNTPQGRQDLLLADLIEQLHERGMVPGPGECYSFKTPPVLGGAIDPDNVELSDLAVWVSIAGQIHHQVKDLPAGTNITGFTKS